MKVDGTTQREGWASMLKRMETPRKDTSSATDKPKAATEKKAAQSNAIIDELKARKKYMAAIHQSPFAAKTSTAKSEQAIDLMA
jgi:hypothetical protein